MLDCSSGLENRGESEGFAEEGEMESAEAETGQGNESLQTVAPRAPVTYERIVTTGGFGIPKPRE